MNTLAGIPPAFDEKLGNMSISFWPEAVKFAEHPRVTATELALLRGMGTRSAIRAAVLGRVEIKDIRGRDTIEQLFQSVLLEGFTVVQLGYQFPWSNGSLSGSSRSRDSGSRRRAVVICPSIKTWNSRKKSDAEKGGVYRSRHLLGTSRWQRLPARYRISTFALVYFQMLPRTRRSGYIISRGLLYQFQFVLRKSTLSHHVMSPQVGLSL
jgi:hypothetical protein